MYRKQNYNPSDLLKCPEGVKNVVQIPIRGLEITFQERSLLIFPSSTYGNCNVFKTMPINV